MKMSDKEISNRLGRRPGQQGPRTPVDSAGLDKYPIQTSSTKQTSSLSASPSSSPPNRKRRLVSLPEQSNPILEPWPHFLVLHSLDPNQQMTSLSPFLLWKDVINIIKEKPKKMSKLASGDYLIEVDQQSHSCILRQTKSILNIPISVIPHKTLNISKGIIRCRDITMCSEDEILENLLDQGVINVKRIRVKRDGSLVATHTYILEFNNPTLPTAVKVAWLNIQVEEYVPNPLRCFKCQLYGHHKDRCSKPAVCANCGQIHTENPCPNPPFCINCKETHPASDRNCKTWKTEKEILAVRNRMKISHPEARKIVAARTPKDKSYAATLKIQTANASTQTDASTNTPFIFQGNSKVVSTNKPKATDSQNTQPLFVSSQSQTSQPSQSSSSSFTTVISRKQKWVKGKNSPKSQKPKVSANRRKDVRDEILAKNRFDALAHLEGMEIDSSQSPPSTSPKTTKSRSPIRGANRVGNSQHSTPVDSLQSSQGRQRDLNSKDGEVATDHPLADIPPAPPDNTDKPTHDYWDGSRQIMADEENLPPQPKSTVPPDKSTGTTETQKSFIYDPVTAP